MRYFLHLAYLGSNYNGWQRQKNTQNCIQTHIEAAFLKTIKSDTPIIGCGRTDAGVHAKQFFAHFDLEKELPEAFVQKLNWILPSDIAIFEVLAMSEKAHARYDAIKRSYEYHLHFEKIPLIYNISSYYFIKKLDIDFIKQGLDHIVQLKDFYHLCLTPDRNKNTSCDIFEASLTVSEDEKSMYFTFTANRFLKSMIRMIVARLLALALKKISFDEFCDSKISNQSMPFDTLAFPQGLHLTKVIYPYLHLETKSSIRT